MYGKMLYIIYLIKTPKYKKAFKQFTQHCKHTLVTVTVAAISSLAQLAVQLAVRTELWRLHQQHVSFGPPWGGFQAGSNTEH